MKSPVKTFFMHKYEQGGGFGRAGYTERKRVVDGFIFSLRLLEKFFLVLFSNKKSNDNLSHSTSQSKVKWKGMGEWKTMGVSLSDLCFVSSHQTGSQDNRFLPVYAT